MLNRHVPQRMIKKLFVIAFLKLDFLAGHGFLWLQEILTGNGTLYNTEYLSTIYDLIHGTFVGNLVHPHWRRK